MVIRWPQVVDKWRNLERMVCLVVERDVKTRTAGITLRVDRAYRRKVKRVEGTRSERRKSPRGF